MSTFGKRSAAKNVLLLVLSFVLIAKISMAQDSTASTRPTTLSELKGYTPTYYYSRGAVHRAKNIAGFIERAITWFQKEIGFTPEATVYILAPGHWKEFAAKPLQTVYGFPHNLDNYRLVIAAEDNHFWRSFLPSVDQLPPTVAAQVTKAYGKSGGSLSMMSFFDLLALHELGHSYAGQAGLKMQRKWMSELFVNIMLHTYVAEKEPALLPALETFPGMVVSGGTTGYAFTSLEDFEKLYETMGMGPKNYGWYQCRLHAAAKDIYDAGGKAIFQKLWVALKTHQEQMTDDGFVSMLQKEVHPAVADVYLKWNQLQ